MCKIPDLAAEVANGPVSEFDFDSPLQNYSKSKERKDFFPSASPRWHSKPHELTFQGSNNSLINLTNSNNNETVFRNKGAIAENQMYLAHDHQTHSEIIDNSKEEKANRDRSEEIISFLEIEDIKDTPVGKLPYGLQKKVELGRALATDSSVILLDEPMAGMNVEEKRDMCRFILKVNDELGTTMVLIEHDMGVVMDISDRVVVLDYGKVIGDGTPDEVRSNQKVIDAYLGVEH